MHCLNTSICSSIERIWDFISFFPVTLLCGRRKVATMLMTILFLAPLMVSTIVLAKVLQALMAGLGFMVADVPSAGI